MLGSTIVKPVIAEKLVIKLVSTYQFDAFHLVLTKAIVNITPT